MEYGCIGKKLTHSFSKIVHGKLADYPYELREVPEEELDGFLRRADFKAINVTIPYKEAVMPYLAEISDTARQIGAVNTIVNRDGRLYGYNTDLAGMTALLRRQGVSLEGKKVLVTGSGGTSKTAVATARAMGAAQVVRLSRTAREDAVTYEAAPALHGDAEALINTTPCGMYPHLGDIAESLDDYPALTSVTDAVYNPLCPALVVEARQRGLNASGGLYMLVAQAAYAVEKFTGKPVREAEIEAVYAAIEAEKRNLVLIGMPGSRIPSILRFGPLMTRIFIRFSPSPDPRPAGISPQAFGHCPPGYPPPAGFRPPPPGTGGTAPDTAAPAAPGWRTAVGLP